MAMFAGVNEWAPTSSYSRCVCLGIAIISTGLQVQPGESLTASVCLLESTEVATSVVNQDAVVGGVPRCRVPWVPCFVKVTWSPSGAELAVQGR